MNGENWPLRTLDSVDLSSLGQPRRDQLGDLSVGITAPVGLPEAGIAALVSDAIVRMAEDFGFTGSAA